MPLPKEIVARRDLSKEQRKTIIRNYEKKLDKTPKINEQELDFLSDRLHVQIVLDAVRLRAENFDKYKAYPMFELYLLAESKYL